MQWNPPTVLGWLRRAVRPAEPLYRALGLWNDAGGLRMAAAMSFYGMLSLAPLLLVMVGVLGWWMDRQMLTQALVDRVGSLVGPQGAAVVTQALASAREPTQGVVASVLGFAVLLFGATGVFGELQDAFARIWTAGGPLPKTGWRQTLSARLRGVGYVLVFGFLLLVSVAASTFLSSFSGWLANVPFLETGLRVVNETLAFGVCTVLFVSLMRLSAGPKPALRFLVAGAVLGAVLFSAGRQLLAWYLSTAAVVSAYGAAGALVVLLMWLYFSNAVLLFGAAAARAAQDTRDRQRGLHEPHEGAPRRANGFPHLRAVAGTQVRRPARDGDRAQRFR